MKTIKFFHPEDTFTYFIEKCFCKVIYSGNQHLLLIEIHSNDDLDHVEGDSLQNDFPQVILSVDDFPVDVNSLEELDGLTIQIPTSYVEAEDEEGDVVEYYYTNANFVDDNYEVDSNSLQFFKDANGILCVKWTGEIPDFTEETDEMIPFEINCAFLPQMVEVAD